MKSSFWILMLVICPLCFTNCGSEEKEKSPLDSVASILEAQAPFYWEEEAFHKEIVSKSGKGKAILDVNRVEVSEDLAGGSLTVMLRNSVRVEVRGESGDWVWTLDANEGMVLPNYNVRFRKGVLVDLGDGVQFEADSLEINRKERRFTTGAGFRLYTQVLLAEEDSKHFAVLEGDSISASYSFDEWEIKGVQVSIPETDTAIAN